MQVVVTNCMNCPLFIDDMEYGDRCSHPITNEGKGKLIPLESYNEKNELISSPNWCQLTKEPLIITKPTNTKTATYMTIKPEENEQWRYM